MPKLTHFLTHEALNLSIGYLAGLSASHLVAAFFVKRGLSNLWGLSSKRTVISGDTYEWLTLITSYVIGLIVLLLVTFLMQRLRGQTQEEE